MRTVLPLSGMGLLVSLVGFSALATSRDGVRLRTSAQAAPVVGTRPRCADANRATVPELEAMPRIGPSLAKRLVDYRVAHGAFRGETDLIRVTGIGSVLAAQLGACLTKGAPALADKHP